MFYPMDKPQKFSGQSTTFCVKNIPLYAVTKRVQQPRKVSHTLFKTFFQIHVSEGFVEVYVLRIPSHH